MFRLRNKGNRLSVITGCKLNLYNTINRHSCFPTNEETYAQAFFIIYTSMTVYIMNLSSSMGIIDFVICSQLSSTQPVRSKFVVVGVNCNQALLMWKREINDCMPTDARVFDVCGNDMNNCGGRELKLGKQSVLEYTG